MVGGTQQKWLWGSYDNRLHFLTVVINYLPKLVVNCTYRIRLKSCVKYNKSLVGKWKSSVSFRDGQYTAKA